MPDGIGIMGKRKLVIGVVTGAHGVRGLVRVKSFTADPADLTAYGPLTDASGSKTFDLTVKGDVKGQILAAIAGCADRNAAEALRGTELYLDRDLLPETEEEGEFYHADLIGLDAVGPEGQAMGTVRAIYDFGSGDMLEIVDGEGRAELYAFTSDVVPDVDLEAGRLTIVPPASVEDEEGDA